MGQVGGGDGQDVVHRGVVVEQRADVLIDQIVDLRVRQRGAKTLAHREGDKRIADLLESDHQYLQTSTPLAGSRLACDQARVALCSK